MKDVDHAGLLDAMTEGMYVVDERRTITFWNRAAGEISGYGTAETVGRWCGDGLLNHVDEAGAALCGTRCPLRATIHDGRTRAVRVYLHHRDGHLVPVRVTASALRDEDGTIVGAVETFTDDSAMVTALGRLDQAERLACTDTMTGLGNRRHLAESLRRRLADRARDGLAFGVLMIDLDRFKGINDTFGHLVGDDVLTTVARSVSHALRAGDDFSRYGGDEFVVLTGTSTLDDLSDLAARIRMVIAQSRYPRLQGVGVSATIGVTIATDDDDAQAILSRADRALLSAKEHRRGVMVLAP